jgi:hypothetical protein
LSLSTPPSAPLSSSRPFRFLYFRFPYLDRQDGPPRVESDNPLVLFNNDPYVI